MTDPNDPPGEDLDKGTGEPSASGPTEGEDAETPQPEDSPPPDDRSGKWDLKDLEYHGDDEPTDDRAVPPKESDPESEGLIDRRFREAAGIPSPPELRRLAEIVDPVRVAAERAGLLGIGGFGSEIDPMAKAVRELGMAGLTGESSFPETVRREIGLVDELGGIERLIGGGMSEAVRQEIGLLSGARTLTEAFADPLAFREDIRLTRQLLGDFDITRAIGDTGLPAMSTVLANLDSFADITGRAFDAYSVEPEMFSRMVDSLNRSQLDAIGRQASVQLWEEIDRRGWTATPPPNRPTPVPRTDTTLEQPPIELEELLAEAPPEQVEAFRRIRRFWNFLGTGHGNIVVAISLAALPFIFLNSSVQTDVSSETDGDVEIRANDIRGDTTVVNNNIVIVRDVLDIIGEDPDVRAELVQQLREICEAVPDDPMSAPDSAGNAAEQPGEPAAATSQARLDVQLDTETNTLRARSNGAADAQPDGSVRAQRASSADVQPDTAEDGERAAECTSERRQSTATDPLKRAPDEP